MIIDLRKRKAKCFYGIVGLLVLALVPFLLAEQTAPKPAKLEPIFQGNKESNKVAFGCNVFWGEEFIPDMLKTLEENDAHITFFIGGSWAKKNPDILRQIAAKGHELANHSYSHPHPNALSKEKNKEEITKTENLVQEIANVKTTLYAPPYGEYNDTVLEAADELGYPTIMWTVDTVDWKRPPAEIIYNRVMKKIDNGAMILMHPTKPTAEALPKLLKDIKEKGYQITTISDVIK